jgi:lysylphosphatidylglycerol synthetase-like protein (DUF2156 family)
VFRVAENTQLNRNGPSHAYHALATVFALGFKFLAWINGVGAALVLLCAVGAIPTNLAPYLFKLPLAGFIAGLALCGVGLLWSYLVQTSLFSQLVTGRSRRTHWIPLFCTLVAYAMSLAAFVMACWSVLNLSNLAYQNPDYSQSSDDDDSASPDQSEQSGESEQSRDPFVITHESGQQTVVFVRRSTRR